MDWVGQRIKIVMQDGYTKFGICIEQDANFITIRYESRPGTEQIALGSILSIKGVGA